MNPHVPSERTIYVSKQPVGTSVEVLKKEFSAFGQVESVQQKEKGIFIVFTSPDAVAKAQAKPVKVNGVFLSVSKYLDWDKLDLEANVFIENIDPKITHASLEQLLSKYGRIQNIKINMSDKAGVAYIQFEKRDSADACIKDSAKLGLRIIKYVQKKTQTSQVIRDQLYISDLKVNNLEVLKQDLTSHFQEFGELESITVNNSKQGTQFAFVKFVNARDALKAVRSNKPFQGQPLNIEWVITGNDKDMEANLFTKNLRSTVNEEQLRKACELIVPVEDLKFIKPKPKKQFGPTTLKAALYLRSAEDGKKFIDQAIRHPEMIALYEKGTVLISPMLPRSDLSAFYQMKMNEQASRINNKYPQPIAPYPYQQNPQYPYPQPQNYYPQPQPYPYQNQQSYQQYPPRQYPRQQYPPRPRNLPSYNYLKGLIEKGQAEEVKQQLGPLIYNLVLPSQGQAKTPAITGILIDFENYTLSDQYRMLSDAAFLNENIGMAADLLQKS